MTISFRPMAPADRQFVLSGWSSSYRTSKHAGLIRNSRWATVMHEEIGAFIDAPTTRVIVACEPGELDHEGREFLYGSIAFRPADPPYVFYVYVKRSYRSPKKFRIGSQLFAAAGIDPSEPFVCASSTAISERILAMCRCGLHRNDHISATDCPRFRPKYTGVFDPVPAREEAA